MKRLTDETVFSGFVTAWFFAALPTTRSPSLRKPSTDGVVRGVRRAQIDAQNLSHYALPLFRSLSLGCEALREMGVSALSPDALKLVSMF